LVNARDFIKGKDACQEGVDWLDSHPEIVEVADGWDLMYKDGNRFIFWVHSRCPFLSIRDRLNFALDVRNILGEDFFTSRKEEVDPVIVRIIMSKHLNPYRGKSWEA
jgi:hypothetical protein